MQKIKAPNSGKANTTKIQHALTLMVLDEFKINKANIASNRIIEAISDDTTTTLLS